MQGRQSTWNFLHGMLQGIAISQCKTVAAVKLKREQGGVRKKGVSGGAVLGADGCGYRGRSGCQAEAAAFRLRWKGVSSRSHVGRGWSCDAFEYFTFRQFPISQPPASRLSGSCYSHGETRAVGDSRNSSSEGAAAGRTPRRSHAHPLPAPGAAHAAPHGESPG